MTSAVTGGVWSSHRIWTTA